MSTLEKVIAICITVVVIVFVPAGMNIRDCGNSLELCAMESVDSVLADIKADGLMTSERYAVLASLLYACGYTSEFEVVSYYYEQGIDGLAYQYKVSFAEIWDVIEQEGVYRFKHGSFINLRVPAETPFNLITRILYSRQEINKSIKVG